MSSFGTPPSVHSLAASFAAQQMSHGKPKVASKESREALRRVVDKGEIRAADSVELTEAVVSKPDAVQEEKHRRNQQQMPQRHGSRATDADPDAPPSHLDLRA